MYQYYHILRMNLNYEKSEDALILLSCVFVT